MKQTVFAWVAAGALALSLGGCVPPPGGYATGAPYYPPAQPAYPAPPPDYGADQLTYVDGSPYAVVGGQQLAVIFDGGLGWGYYDGYHHWHGAPGGWRGDLERRYPGGRGFEPRGQAGYGGGYRPGGYPGGSTGGYQPPPGRQPGPPPGQPQGQPPGYRISAPGPGPGPGGPRPQPAPPPPRQAAPPPRPAPAPAPRGFPACGQPGAPRC